tara:strand:+ start:390 stop:581 length:192 start_codon:yes stop_codon:yes gene_type:complete
MMKVTKKKFMEHLESEFRRVLKNEEALRNNKNITAEARAMWENRYRTEHIVLSNLINFAEEGK